MSDLFLPLHLEIADLPRGRAALIRYPIVFRGVPSGMRFVDANDHETEGEFRAAIGDAVVQILDELL